MYSVALDANGMIVKIGEDAKQLDTWIQESGRHDLISYTFSSLSEYYLYLVDKEYPLALPPIE